MDYHETQAFIQDHARRFQKVATWYRKAQREDIGTWYETLSDVSTHEAEEASRAMHAGELKQPFDASSHPAAIRQWILAQRAASRSSNASKTSDRCQVCDNQGIVLIYTGQAVNAAMQHDERPKDYLQGAICGSCSPMSKHVKYDPSRHYIADEDTDWQAFCQRVESTDAMTMAGEAW